MPVPTIDPLPVLQSVFGFPDFRGVQRDVVTANAALALRCARPGLAWPEALAQARESLDSGAARGAFQRMLAAQ